MTKPTTDKTEHARRLAICAECPHAVLTVIGGCDTCKRRHYVHAAKDDGDLACRKTKGCQGTVQGKEIARCGACGCPLASRVYWSCPKGKW